MSAFSKVLIFIADLIVWFLSAGFGCCGVLCSVGVISSLRQKKPEKKSVARFLALALTVVGILSFAAFVGCAIAAIRLFQMGGGVL